MSKVYLVHRESGEYSDWTFVPLAVFTTREKAVEFIERQRIGLVRYYYGNGLEVAESWQEPTSFTHPSTTDGSTWEIPTSEGGVEIYSYYNKPYWYIDELDLDPTEVSE